MTMNGLLSNIFAPRNSVMHHTPQSVAIGKTFFLLSYTYGVYLDALDLTISAIAVEYLYGGAVKVDLLKSHDEWPRWLC